MNSRIFPKISNFETILMKPIDIRIITRYLIGRHHLWSIHLIGHLVRNLICRLAITHLGKLVWVGLSHMTKTLGQLRTIFKNISFGWNYFCVKSINRSWFLKTKIFHLKSFQDFQVRGSFSGYQIIILLRVNIMHYWNISEISQWAAIINLEPILLSIRHIIRVLHCISRLH